MPVRSSPRPARTSTCGTARRRIRCAVETLPQPPLIARSLVVNRFAARLSPPSQRCGYSLRRCRSKATPPKASRTTGDSFAPVSSRPVWALADGEPASDPPTNRRFRQYQNAPSAVSRRRVCAAQPDESAQQFEDCRSGTETTDLLSERLPKRQTPVRLVETLQRLIVFRFQLLACGSILVEHIRSRGRLRMTVSMTQQRRRTDEEEVQVPTLTLEGERIKLRQIPLGTGAPGLSGIPGAPAATARSIFRPTGRLTVH